MLLSGKPEKRGSACRRARRWRAACSRDSSEIFCIGISQVIDFIRHNLTTHAIPISDSCGIAAVINSFMETPPNPIPI